MTLFMLMCACQWVREALWSLGPVRMSRARLLEFERLYDH